MRRAIVICIAVTVVSSFAATSAVAETRKGFFEALSDSFQGKNSKNKRTTYRAPARSDRVMEIQLYLNTLGFDAGRADGLLGAKTRNAISDYQTARGLTPTGKLSDDQFATLKAEADGSLQAESEETIEVQSLLLRMGFFEGEADGEWGPDSQDALDMFRSFVGLPLGGPPTVEDMDTLKEAVLAVAPPEADVFDTLTLFGNNFSLAEPDLQSASLTWEQIRPHVFLALPQSRFLTLRAIEAKSLIADRVEQTIAAYEAQIALLHALLRPEIQTYVGKHVETDEITKSVNAFDIEIARHLLAGTALKMLRDYDMYSPGAERAMRVAQETAYRLQALRILEDYTIEIVPTHLANDTIETTPLDELAVVPVDGPESPPVLISTLPTAAKIKGLNIFGLASDTANTWPYILEFTDFNAINGEFEGQLEWTNLDTIHNVRGTLTRDGALSFTEYTAVGPGETVTGCEYKLTLPPGSQASLQGSFNCAGDTGSASAEFPESFAWANLPAPQPDQPN